MDPEDNPDVRALKEGGYPPWVLRALDPRTPQTPQGETVRSGSSYSKELGGELLYPTIRMGEDGQLQRLDGPDDDPLGAAMAKGDYILLKGPPDRQTADRATALSKYISNMIIGPARQTLGE